MVCHFYYSNKKGQHRRVKEATLQPMWNKVPPTFDPTSREYNVGYTLSKAQWQVYTMVYTQQLYQALLKFTDLSDGPITCRIAVL